MILTCNTCPRQLCFKGVDRNLFVSLFGWMKKGNRFFCNSCGEITNDQPDH